MSAATRWPSWTRTLALGLLASGAGSIQAQAPTAPAATLSPAQLFAQVSPSVWRVLSLDRRFRLIGQGSGVVTQPDHLVTNCHVLKNAQRVRVRHDNPVVSVAAELVMWDVQRDLCQLYVPGLPAPAVVLAAAATAAVGQPVYAVGYPGALDLTMSAGQVSAFHRNDAGQLGLIQNSAAASPGSSGGGLFNELGELLGLTKGGFDPGDAKNLHFAIPAEWIADLPRRHAAARMAAPAASAPPWAASRRSQAAEPLPRQND